MQKLASDHRLKTVLLVLMAAVVLAITVTRAAITEITYDEAFTYMAYAQEIRFDELDTFRYVYNESVANNHWLNTVAIAAVERMLGVSYCEFAIRLRPYELYRMADKFRDKVVILGGILCIRINVLVIVVGTQCQFQSSLLPKDGVPEAQQQFVGAW